jgi:hypothetical protein
MRSHSGKRIRK